MSIFIYHQYQLASHKHPLSHVGLPTIYLTDSQNKHHLCRHTKDITAYQSHMTEHRSSNISTIKRGYLVWQPPASDKRADSSITFSLPIHDIHYGQPFWAVEPVGFKSACYVSVCNRSAHGLCILPQRFTLICPLTHSCLLQCTEICFDIWQPLFLDCRLHAFLSISSSRIWSGQSWFRQTP